MKIYKIILPVLFLSQFVFWSCERELTSKDATTKITTYAIITLSGDNPMFLEIDEAYVEPGATTNTGDEVVISGDVEASTAGSYVVSYSTVNVDGFPSSETREVWVNNTGDLVTSIEGIYISDVSRVDPAGTYINLTYVLIIKTGDNTYELTHALGGFYSLGRSYGYDYEGQGAIITANDIPANNFVVSDSDVPAWGDTASTIDFMVDATNGIITYTTLYAGYEFHITLTQLQL